MSVSVEHPTGRENFYIVWADEQAVAFSYKTIIGVNQLNGSGWLVAKNEWGPTTGKHLNYLEADKSKRIPQAEVEALVRI